MACLDGLKADLEIETERLSRAWAHHDPSWLRDYLVSGVEDPRLNLQSILCRHFFIRILTQSRFEGIMRREYEFAAAMNWLLGQGRVATDPDERAAILHALEKGADNAEGLQIPGFVLRIFANLSIEEPKRLVPNYLRDFLSSSGSWPAGAEWSQPALDTFQAIWNSVLAHEQPAPLSVLEPACGSANDYRFLNRYGIAALLDYKGFDLCAKNIENARSLFPEARFETGNIFAIPAGSKSFDLCIVQDLFEHLSISGLEQAVHEVCRVTRKGMCIGFFQMDERGDHIVRPIDDYHWNLLSMSKMLAMFKQHGFSGQVIHIGRFLTHETGCTETYNPDAYTFLLRAL